MSIKVKLYTKIVDLLNVVIGRLNVSLAEYQFKKNEAHADAFLKEFRSRDGYYPISLQERPDPNPTCTHKKGGGGSQSAKFTPYADYNIICHRFPDGSSKAWCGYNCGFVARPGDKNWAEAMKMLESSSNHASSSEIIFSGTQKGRGVIVTVQDKVPS